MFKQHLLNDKLLVRFGALLVVVMLSFLVSWTLSYLLIPEGMLRGRTVGHVWAGSGLAGGSVWLEWLRILAINLGVMLVVIVAPNLFRTESHYPFGYGTVILLAVNAGTVLGTDSFAIPLGGKVPPTIAVFESSGLYEITAYVLASAATYSITRWRLVGKWPKQTVERPALPATPSVLRERKVGLLVAIVILAAACAWEAYRISLVVAP